MPTIGQKTVEAAADKIRALLIESRADLDKAWLKCEKSLSIPISLKFKDGPGYGDMEYSVSMDIITDRVKPSGHGIVNENQAELFPKTETPKTRKGPIAWFAMPDCRLDVYRQ